MKGGGANAVENKITQEKETSLQSQRPLSPTHLLYSERQGPFPHGSVCREYSYSSRLSSMCVLMFRVLQTDLLAGMSMKSPHAILCTWIMQ